MEKLNSHWFFKFKLHHLAFWAVYHFSWWAVFEGSITNTFNNIANPPYTLKYAFYVIVQAIGVYFCLYFLIPRFLEKRQYLKFLGLMILSIIVMSTTIASGYLLTSVIFDTPMEELFKVDNPSLWFFIKSNSLPSCIGAMTLGMSIKLAKNYLQSQQRQQELEREKLETELKFLRSQFNPHFLFNTINSIFVLINRDQSQASDSLAKFSGLLRYQLYECNEKEIPLNRELAYLESFIELEKLRLDSSFETNVKLPTGKTGNLNIAPFVLMPFVENAFKHVSKTPDHSNWIKIAVNLNGSELHYSVSNSVSNESKANDAVEFSGLGLQNVARRLNLLYPDRHRISTKQDESAYLAELKIQLSPAGELHNPLAIKTP